MDQIIDITVPTAIACLGVFFIMMIIEAITNQIWVSSDNSKVRAVIKWVWTVWTPIWPVVIGGAGGFIKDLPMPEMIKALGPTPGLTSVIYGAFCGMISLAVVKQIKYALEQKGIDVTLPTLPEAKSEAKEKRIEMKRERRRSHMSGTPSSGVPSMPISGDFPPSGDFPVSEESPVSSEVTDVDAEKH